MSLLCARAPSADSTRRVAELALRSSSFFRLRGSGLLGECAARVSNCAKGEACPTRAVNARDRFYFSTVKGPRPCYCEVVLPTETQEKVRPPCARYLA